MPSRNFNGGTKEKQVNPPEQDNGTTKTELGTS